MTVAMALAEATHHAAPRRQKPACAITVNDAPRGQRNAGAEYFELSSDEEVAPGGVRPGERVQRHTLKHAVAALSLFHVELWFRVWVQASASCFLGQTRLVLVPFCAQAPDSTRVSNTFRLRFLVCVHASVPALCFECVWIVDPCLCTRIRLQPCSNTFDLGCLFVYKFLCL